ncbi:MAG: aminopeptidase P N-terminal domain-containing protein [Bacteroidales bacterium]|nr:aminopeptidase P N-terminal domain-containing protein [Bacteroidales bacterium]
MFNASTYSNRRKALKNSINSGILLFLGNNESPMNYFDNTYHFRQDSTFLYFFGLDFPGLSAIIDIDEGSEIVFGNDLTVEDIVWMGAQPTLKERAQAFDILNVQALHKLNDYLNQAKLSGREIHFLPPYRPDNKIQLYNLLGIHPEEIKQHASIEFIKGVVKQRNYKSQEEIVEIEKAVDISVDMHVAAIRLARTGMKEAELAAAAQQVAIAASGQLSFPIIMTINGQTLHNHYHGNTLKSGDMVLCDCGAETEMHYAGDLSSTFPVDAKFTTIQKQIYEVTLRAHEAALTKLAPGIPFRDIHMAAGREIVVGLSELGIMKGDPDEAIAAGAHAMFFPCGTGHMMGLDVHDMEDLGEEYVGYDGKAKSTMFGLKSLRLARPLEPGFVLTIEPGIYFIPELIDQWRTEKRHSEFINYHEVEKYRAFSGIRNEEDFLITADGYRVLGKPKPKTIKEVESLR